MQNEKKAGKFPGLLFRTYEIEPKEVVMERLRYREIGLDEAVNPDWSDLSEQIL
jgi:hypothetical protein